MDFTTQPTRASSDGPHPDQAVRKEWHAPSLHSLGSLWELTASGTSSFTLEVNPRCFEQTPPPQCHSSQRP